MSQLNYYDFDEQNGFIPKNYSVSVSANDKVISIEDDGSLLASLSMNLTGDKLSLIGKDSQQLSEVTIPLASGIKEGYYDSVTRDIVLVVSKQGGEESEVRFSVDDLVDIYTSGDGIYVDENRKVNIKINEDSKEILSADAQGLKIDLTTYDNLIDAIEAVNEEQTNAINNEASERENKDVELEGLINGVDSKVDGVKSSLDELSGKVETVNTEISEITSNHDSLKSEVDSIKEQVNNLPTDSVIDEVKNSIIAESQARQDADNTLSEKIDNVKSELDSEIEGLKNEDTSLSNKINEVESNLSQEIQNRILADGELDDKINSEISRAEAKENEIEQSISDEISAREEADSRINTILDNKVDWIEETDESGNNPKKTIQIENGSYFGGKKTDGSVSKIASISDSITIGDSSMNLDLVGSDETIDYNGKEIAFVSNINDKMSTIRLLKSEENDLQYYLEVDGNNVGEINIPKDNYLKNARYDGSTKQLIFGFGTESGLQEVKVDVSAFIDIYTAGNGLFLASNEFSVKVDTTDEGFVKVSENGLKTAGIKDYVDTAKQALNDAISKKVSWTDSPDAEYPNKKSIVLNNEDYIVSKDSLNAMANIAKVNKNDKVVFGDASHETIVNVKQNSRLSVKEGQNSHDVAYVSEVNDVIGSSSDTIDMITLYGVKAYAKNEANKAGANIDDKIAQVDSKFSSYITKSEATTAHDELKNELNATVETKVESAKSAAITESNNHSDAYTDNALSNVNTSISNLTNTSNSLAARCDHYDVLFSKLVDEHAEPSSLTVYTKIESDALFETKEHANETFATKVDLSSNIASVEYLSSLVSVLEGKISDLKKGGNILIETLDNVTALTDSTQNYILSGNLTETSTISGKSVEIKDATVTDGARLNLNASEGDVDIKSTTFSGDFPKSSGNSISNVNNSEYVTFKDVTFDSTVTGYNGVEIGLKSSTMPKSVTFDGCSFEGAFSNNAIIVFGVQEGGVININNCNFKNVSNALRFSNSKNVKDVVINITNCTCEKWETNPSYAGFLLFEDYTSATATEANENNLFAPEKITVNITNLVGPNGRINSIEGAINSHDASKQVAYVYYDKVGLISDESRTPKFNIN